LSGLKNHICEAARFGGVHACGRCSLTWPASARGDDVPACKERPEPAITLPAMGQFLMARARQLEQSQAALVVAGDRAEPFMPALHEAAAYRAIDRLLALIHDDEDLRDLIRQKSAGR
jgi:hypothetical protein